VATFTLAKGLDEKVAPMVRQDVNRVVIEVHLFAMRYAPPLKTWRTMRDSVVRREHRRTDRQARPVNVPFKLPTHPWDREHRGLGPWTYLQFPRDHADGRVVVNIRNCRCVLDWDDGGIAKLIDLRQAQVDGTRVHGLVWAEGEWVVESELGDAGGLGFDGYVVQPWYYMRRAAHTAAQRANMRSA